MIVGHYMFRASYTVDGIKGLLKEGASGRGAAIRGLIEGLGGKLETMYWAFGQDDIVLIVELPDNSSAAAIAAAVGASGAAAVSTTVLITAEEMDAAAKLQVGYRPPGG